jgi:hypothetical protein
MEVVSGGRLISAKTERSGQHEIELSDGDLCYHLTLSDKRGVGTVRRLSLVIPT